MTASRPFRGLAALLLLAAAAAVALPFRARVLAQADPTHYSWDAAHHVLAGLDLADDVRRLALPSAVARLLTSRWWGPLWALLTAPLYAFCGASIRTATLLPLAAFVLTPAAAWLFVRRTTGTAGLLAAPIVLVLLLRSPLLLEASAWPMFETFGGLASLVAWLLFGRGTRTGARAAFAVAAALFFLKYHYGVFLGTALLLATLGALPRGERRRTSGILRALLAKPLVSGFLVLVALLAVSRLLTERAGPPRLLPSVSNTLWGALAVVVLSALVFRRAARDLWRALPEPLRDFALFAGSAPLAWLLDPANTRAFWRQIHQDWVTDPPGPLTNARQLASFFPDDFVSSPWTLPLLLGGLALAFVLGRRDRTLPFAALFAAGPPVAMCFAAFPLEPRFLGCLLPTLYAGAAAGLVLGVRAVSPRWRPAASAALLLALLAPLPAAEARFRAAMDGRVRFGYPNSREEDRFVAELVAALPDEEAILVALPPEWRIGPTIRLGLRLSRRSLAPEAIVAGEESVGRLLDELPRGTRRLVLASADGEAPAGFTRVARRAGPPLPDGRPYFFDTFAR